MRQRRPSSQPIQRSKFTKRRKERNTNTSAKTNTDTQYDVYVHCSVSRPPCTDKWDNAAPPPNPSKDPSSPKDEKKEIQIQVQRQTQIHNMMYMFTIQCQGHRALINETTPLSPQPLQRSKSTKVKEKESQIWMYKDKYKDKTQKIQQDMFKVYW